MSNMSNLMSQNKRPDLFAEVCDNMDAMSPDVKLFFARVGGEILEYAQEHQLPPRQVVAGVAPVLGGLALIDVHWNSADTGGVEDFLSFASNAMRFGVKLAIKDGPKP